MDLSILTVTMDEWLKIKAKKRRENDLAMLEEEKKEPRSKP